MVCQHINADSMAYNKTKVVILIPDALFDSQFKGICRMQNDSGHTDYYCCLLKRVKQDIVNPSDMSKSEVKGVSSDFLLI